MSNQPKTETGQPPAQPPCGWTKLWHPRAVQVTFPVLDISPVGSLLAISAYLDAGWLAMAPGLEEGEAKASVGWVLRSAIEQEGRCTPFLLLYEDDPQLKFSFLKIYLDDDADYEAFEYASGMKFKGFPDYVGDNKPERGKSSKVDQFIIRAPKPFGVVFKKNPKHDPSETDLKKKKPARLFVRWERERPTAKAAEGSGEHTKLPEQRVNGPIIGGIERVNTDETIALMKLIEQCKVNMTEFLKHYKISALTDMPIDQLKDANEKLNAKLAAKK